MLDAVLIHTTYRIVVQRLINQCLGECDDWGVVTEIVQDGGALSRALELAYVYLRVPEVTRRNTRVHFTQPSKERIVREVGFGLSLEGASAADLMKSMQAMTKA